ncbi:calcium-transporting ATPase 12, plasma membrane-type-like [Camellia sinensis]|uniref:calcium-transporting ATPase 12, plasma membrane-type-like n=1 Tax=Camellia sinensis TaxID=4442 RepID=UPI0010363660|nr:calcium-transporting ATPase 12, plasma membrane-type-like [Camellia sinensis]
MSVHLLFSHMMLQMVQLHRKIRCLESSTILRNKQFCNGPSVNRFSAKDESVSMITSCNPFSSTIVNPLYMPYISTSKLEQESSFPKYPLSQIPVSSLKTPPNPPSSRSPLALPSICQIVTANIKLQLGFMLFGTQDPCSYLTSLVEAFNTRNLDNLNRNFGGIEGVVSRFNSNESTGIHGDTQDLSLRRRTYGPNTYPQIPKRSISQLMLAELNHTVRLTQLICVLVYIIVFSFKLHGLGDDGLVFYRVKVFFIVYLPLTFQSLFFRSIQIHDACKHIEQLLQICNTANIQSEVIRNGNVQRVPCPEIVVGDVVVLEAGDVVPADGLFLVGSDCFQVYESKVGRMSVSRHQNPFLIVGGKVIRGYAGMLVISVGINTTWGNPFRLVTKNPVGLSLFRVRGIKINDFLDKIFPAAAFFVVLFTNA